MKQKTKQALDNAYMDAQIRAGKNLKGEDLKKKCLCALAVWMRNHEEEE